MHLCIRAAATFALFFLHERLAGGFAGSGPLLRDSDVQAVLGSNVLPVFRLLHAEVAAAAAVLARNIRLATGHIPVSLYCT